MASFGCILSWRIRCFMLRKIVSQRMKIIMTNNILEVGLEGSFSGS